ncbi:hypothetical protein P691DRAFT_784473 [Macrolepiota fuliginosa MF-IS2]|uniref:Uncharacterized protein n=1 Tax=Macrolepiota fuliginosa MF-IS2 TaxID=1400762 RepID=A0A9P5XMK6_9AGAR|nr:hypothetical protein P691DRAFT_784473 [Macrolepiota fuliginosa MF-IS2]
MDGSPEWTAEVCTHRVTLQKNNDKILQPQVPMNNKQCLVSFVTINGIDAWMLWDSGSTTSGITPMFAQIANVKVNELLDPHTLQLGTVGSTLFMHKHKVQLNFERLIIVINREGPKDPKVKVEEVPNVDLGTQRIALGVESPLLIDNGDDNEVATNIATAGSTRPASYEAERSVEPCHGRHGEDPDVSGGD